MKNFLKYATTATVILAVAAPALAGLVLPTPPPTGSGQSLTGSGIVNIITTIVNYVITVAVVIAVGMFVYGGIKYAMGDAKATGILKNAAIGLLAILGVGLLINTIAGLINRGLQVG